MSATVRRRRLERVGERVGRQSVRLAHQTRCERASAHFSSARRRREKLAAGVGKRSERGSAHVPSLEMLASRRSTAAISMPGRGSNSLRSRCDWQARGRQSLPDAYRDHRCTIRLQPSPGACDRRCRACQLRRRDRRTDPRPPPRRLATRYRDHDDMTGQPSGLSARLRCQSRCCGRIRSIETSSDAQVGQRAGIVVLLVCALRLDRRRQSTRHAAEREVEVGEIVKCMRRAGRRDHRRRRHRRAARRCALDLGPLALLDAIELARRPERQPSARRRHLRRLIVRIVLRRL